MRLIPGTIKSAQIRVFIGSLRKHFRKPVILLWDRLPAHRSKATLKYIAKQKHWLTVKWLPAYSPELNPVEYYWAYVSGTDLANFRAKNLGSVAHQVRINACRVRRRQDLGRAFLKHSGLFK